MLVGGDEEFLSIVMEYNLTNLNYWFLSDRALTCVGRTGGQARVQCGAG